jgi:outer membrane protein OmpA-like peptidoglycan-associated protein
MTKKLLLIGVTCLACLAAGCSSTPPAVPAPQTHLMTGPAQHFYDGEKTEAELSAGTGIVKYDNEPEPFVGPASNTYLLSGQTPDLLVRLGSNDQRYYTDQAAASLDAWLARKVAMQDEMLHPAKIDMTVHFGFNKTEILDPEKLNAVLFSEKLHPNTPVKVTGFTDSIGGAGRHNQILSLQRALEVKKTLVEHGIPDDLVETEGSGSRDPIASNETASGRALNRRASSAIHPLGLDAQQKESDQETDQSTTDQLTEEKNK